MEFPAKHTDCTIYMDGGFSLAGGLDIPHANYTTRDRKCVHRVLYLHVVISHFCGNTLC